MGTCQCDEAASQWGDYIFIPLSQLNRFYSSPAHLCPTSCQVVQDYALEYARAFLDTPFFGFFWSSSLTHDHLNLLNLADESYLQYLQEMAKIGALNNTVLFFVSDHGMRWGAIRSTYIGMLEERLPYSILYLPPWFKKK